MLSLLSQLMMASQAKNLGVILDDSFPNIIYSIHQYVFYPSHQYILPVLSSKYLSLTTDHHTSYHYPGQSHHYFLLGIKSSLSSSLLPLCIFNRANSDLWEATPMLKPSNLTQKVLLCATWSGLHYLSFHFNFISFPYCSFHHSLYQLYRLPCCLSSKCIPNSVLLYFLSHLPRTFSSSTYLHSYSLTSSASLLKSHQSSSQGGFLHCYPI